MPLRYRTPVFSEDDPLFCREIALRPSLWAVVFDLLQILARPTSWHTAEAGHASIEDVIAEIEMATDRAFWARCLMIGEVKWLASEAPEWCLVCDGSTYAKDDYPELWAVLDAAYEIDDDNFRVPDLIARFALGSSTLAVQGGEAEHTMTIDELVPHTHTEEGVGAAPSVVLGELTGFELAPETNDTGSTGGGEPFPIMPPYETLLPVIIARYPDG